MAGELLLLKAKLLIYGISFVSFWIAVLSQPLITSILAEKISPALLGIITVFIMWVLAIFVFPRIGYMFLGKNRS